MPIHPGMVEPLAERTRDLYAAAEERLLAIIARQLADGLEAPGWTQRKLSAVQAMRRAAQAVVDELGKAVTLDVFDVVAEAYNVGRRSALDELGALTDAQRRMVAEVAPGTPAVDRLAQETVDVVTDTHRSILRAVVDIFRKVVAEVTATPLLGTGTRRQATQDAMRRYSDAGIRAFVDRSGRRWQLTSYAEMAVRTSTARAAVEAHARTLTDAGIGLVRVSDAPRECPLCRPWEGEVLALDGPPGPHTVHAEHALNDGQTVTVRVAGNLDAARLAGFQHPNCRHSVSAYLPGVTRIHDAESDPEGYEAGQRQREIERNIRKYKRRAAGAFTPEAKQAANGKVRKWQATMRDHLAAHPDLQRIRQREQPGASNLPTAQDRTAPDPQFVQAARIRAGDERTPAEMTDAELAAAAGSNTLDARAMARVEAEADRRDAAALAGRVRNELAGGDLTGFGDDELTRAVSALDDAESLLSVMAEMDRRDAAARLPGIRRDLARLSDTDLAARAGTSDTAELAAIAAEANRRDMLARIFPAGRLSDDLSQASDDELSWAMQYATAAELARIAEEMDAREEQTAPLPPPAVSGDAVADLLADRDALAEAMRPAPDPEGWGAYADDATWPTPSDAEATASDTEPGAVSDTAPAEAAEEDEAPRLTRREARALYDEYVYRQYLAAEDDTRGYLLNQRATAEGIDPVSLFSGPARIAYARASDELKEWWAQHGRLTQAEFVEQATGQRQRWAAGARISEAEQQNRR